MGPHLGTSHTCLELAQDGGPHVQAERVSGGAQGPADKAPPSRTQMAGLGIFLALALCLAAFGIKAFRSKTA